MGHPICRWIPVTAAFLAAAFLLGGPSAWAADKEKDKKDEEEGKIVEKEPKDLAESVELIKNLMNEVEDLLARLRTGRRTQEGQERIIEELKRVIDKAQEASQSSSSQQQQQQQQQQQEQQDQQQDQGKKPEDQKKSNPREQPLTPPKGQGKVENIRTEERREPPDPRSNPIRKVLGTNADKWGNLPPRDRRDVIDQMSRSVPERFRSDVEKYWKRLADTEGE